MQTFPDGGFYDAETAPPQVNLFVFPVVVGGGTPGLPQNVHVDVELLGERRFANGVVHMHQRTRVD
jgi:hypothetical protein